MSRAKGGNPKTGPGSRGGRGSKGGKGGTGAKGDADKNDPAKPKKARSAYNFYLLKRIAQVRVMAAAATCCRGDGVASLLLFSAAAALSLLVGYDSSGFGIVRVDVGVCVAVTS